VILLVICTICPPLLTGPLLGLTGYVPINALFQSQQQQQPLEVILGNASLRLV
jgi:hypothetical protein